jgi:hypothetical protein
MARLDILTRNIPNRMQEFYPFDNEKMDEMRDYIVRMREMRNDKRILV